MGGGRSSPRELYKYRNESPANLWRWDSLAHVTKSGELLTDEEISIRLKPRLSPLPRAPERAKGKAKRPKRG